jgi:hypothetical protein
MIRYLTLEEVLELHRLVLEQSGGLAGVRDFGSLDSAPAIQLDPSAIEPRGRNDNWAVVSLEMALVGSLRCRRLACDCDPINLRGASGFREFGCDPVEVSSSAERQ